MTERKQVDVSRRRYLAVTGGGLASVTGLAGCLGDYGDDDRNDDTGGDSDDKPTETVAFEPRWQETIAQVANGINYDGTVIDDTLVIGHDEGITGLDVEDGTQVFHRDEWMEFHTVHDAGDVVVALSRDLEVIELDPETGGENWSDDLDGDAMNASSALAGEYVLVSTGTEIVVYEIGTGNVVQQFDAGSRSVVGGDGIAVFEDGFDTRAVDPATGVERWRIETDISPGGSIGEEMLIVPQSNVLDDEDAIIALDVDNGDTLWEVTVSEAGVELDIAIHDGVAFLVESFFGQDDVPIHAIDIVEGEILWSDSLGDVTNAFTPPAVDSGVVVSMDDDDLVAFDAETGDVLDRTGRSFVVMDGLAADGRFFECSREVTAYDLFE